VTAAIYCRKSTTQDVSDEQRSVARQEEHARVYAARELAGQGATSPATVSETNWLAFARQSYDMDIYRFEAGRPARAVLTSTFGETEPAGRLTAGASPLFIALWRSEGRRLAAARQAPFRWFAAATRRLRQADRLWCESYISLRQVTTEGRSTVSNTQREMVSRGNSGGVASIGSLAKGQEIRDLVRHAGRSADCLSRAPRPNSDDQLGHG